ncbi:type II toxin-antitoxin system prevent-host-death family antitoxin [Lysobacter korlensis]|uniref:Type II toxin-antitoxin system prevent-host-death family antitoxin n=1 Tax=Lysobacter korlensis TaxID=553636 RepID=A0ABV6RLV3_9GAMM
MAALPAEATDIPLIKASSSQVQRSWKGVLKLVQKHGRVAVTHHADTEAVLVSREEFERLEQAERELAALKSGNAEVDPVQALRERFMARLRSRDAAEYGDRLDAAFSAPHRLDGQLKVRDRF